MRFDPVKDKKQKLAEADEWKRILALIAVFVGTFFFFLKIVFL